MIDRKALVSRHDILYDRIEPQAPIQLGNGRLCLSADITGFQNLFASYRRQGVPLCTMAEWFWHSYASPSYDDKALEYTKFTHDGKQVLFAVNPEKGNEDVYEYMRKNPHKANLCHFLLVLDGREVDEDSISSVDQRLDLYGGVLVSKFLHNGRFVEVRTWVSPRSDTVCFRVQAEEQVAVRLRFARPSHRIAGEEENDDAGEFVMDGQGLERKIDGTTCRITLSGCRWGDPHTFLSVSNDGMFRFSFAKDCRLVDPGTEEACREDWKRFWMSGGAVDFSHCTADNAFELERRVVLSQYLTRINSTGMYPPAETGLFCNSWYGKFHMEMVPLHILHFALWNRASLIIPMLDWYRAILPKAREEARRNGCKGARWPKMTDPSGRNAPSTIATLLLWQQPHILFLLAAVYRERGDAGWLDRFWPVIKDTADFMTDWATYEKGRDRYSLTPPVIPVQEVFDPTTTYNPSFECCYWAEGLRVAAKLASVLGENAPSRWLEVAGKMAGAYVSDNLYMSAESNPDSFAAHATDHPAMVFPLGYLRGEGIDRNVMTRTLLKVASQWDYSSLWGWDFAFLAMCATRLGMRDLAMDFLLAKTGKNFYATNGCNYQLGRKDLPSYLPGNGSLLMAVAMMCAGYDGCGDDFHGFPENGEWDVRFERIRSMW
jgi:hypothetical protein